MGSDSSIQHTGYKRPTDHNPEIEYIEMQICIVYEMAVMILIT